MVPMWDMQERVKTRKVRRMWGHLMRTVSAGDTVMDVDHTNSWLTQGKSLSVRLRRGWARHMLLSDKPPTSLCSVLYLRKPSLGKVFLKTESKGNPCFAQDQDYSNRIKIVLVQGWACKQMSQNRGSRNAMYVVTWFTTKLQCKVGTQNEAGMVFPENVAAVPILIKTTVGYQCPVAHT